jgi:retron-type reverse transcriptase
MSEAFCLKADIKHYFQEVNHEVLIEIIKRKISDEKFIWLIKQILNNLSHKNGGAIRFFQWKQQLAVCSLPIRE